MAGDPHQTRLRAGDLRRVMPASRARTRKPAARGPKKSGARKAAGGRRKNPRPRHTDGAAPWAKLEARNPNMHYVYVYENDQDYGPDYYASIGYDPVEYSKTGVRPKAGKTAAR